MKKVLYVLLENWADWEFAYAAAAVKELCGTGFENRTVSVSRDPVKSIGGLTCLPDHDLENIPQDYAALILIGGLSWRGEQSENVTPLVHKCLEQGKLLGAICDATRYLARIGVLNNIKHTGNGVGELTAAGEMYTNADGFVAKQAVCDKGIITANGSAPTEFAHEIVCALGAPKKKADDWYTFYKRGYFAE